MYTYDFGRFLAELRKEKGLTQVELAELTAIVGMLVHIIIVYVFSNVREQFLADFIRRLIKYDDINLHLIFEKKVADNIDSNL